MISESVTKDLDKLIVNASDVPEDLMHDTARKRGLRSEYLPQETHVTYEELLDTLRGQDSRRAHQRAMDAALQRSIELYDNRNYDFILKNLEMDVSDQVKTDKYGKKPRTDKWYRTEFDVLLGNIEEGWITDIDAKTRRGKPLDENGNEVRDAPRQEDKAKKQFERRAYIIDLLNERMEGFDWRYLGGETVYDTELNTEYGMPDTHVGTHYWDESSRNKALGSESFNRLLEAADSRSIDLRPESMLSSSKPDNLKDISDLKKF